MKITKQIRDFFAEIGRNSHRNRTAESYQRDAKKCRLAAKSSWSPEARLKRNLRRAQAEAMLKK